MDANMIKSILKIGETIAVEFKRCGNGIENDVYESICSFDNLEPNSKNPIIAAFFRNIGYADQLGSGVRKLFKYSKYYSGKDPQFVEDDVFRIIVPLDDTYSFDYGIENRDSKVIEINNADKMPIKCR